MTEKIISGLLLVVAVIHLIPLVGVVSAGKLESLYGVPINGADLEILMRHRAILFGLIGAFFAYSAFVPAYQPLAFIIAFISIGSFFFLAFTVGGYGEGVKKVVIADIVAAFSLGTAMLLYWLKS